MKKNLTTFMMLL